VIKFCEGYPDMAWILGNSLRKADKRELQALSAYPDLPVPAQLQISLESTPYPFYGIETDGALQGVFGVEPWPGCDSMGAVWMLSTDGLFHRHAKSVHRLARDYFIPEALRKYRVIGNYVHSKNLAHLRWLKRLGFTEDHQIQTARGETFIMMQRSSSIGTSGNLIIKTVIT
jgi:hypothetical protein